jgi:hypothetical protein
MATENYSSASVLISPVDVLYAPMGTTLPDETSVAWKTFSGWHASWVHLGYTMTPTRMAWTYDTTEVSVEQVTTPIKRSKTNERVTFNLELAQFDGANLALILDGANTNTAAGAGQKAFSRVTAGGSTTLNEYMFAIEGVRPDSAGTDQPFRIFVYRATIRANGDIQFAKANGTALPVIVEGLTDTTKTIGQQLMEIQIITAAATA